MELFRPPAFCRHVACISDDARPAAMVSSLVGEEGQYVSVLQGPRMERPDSHNEIVRRCNGIAKLWPDQVMLAGLGRDAEAGIRSCLGKGPRNVTIFAAGTAQDIRSALGAVQRRGLAGELRCRTNDIGLALLLAKRQRKALIVDDAAPTLDTPVASPADHLVVLDDHDPVVQVIAANYAYSIGADLVLIPERDDTIREQVYADLDQRVSFRGQARGKRSQQSLARLQATLAPALQFGRRRFVTFITKGIPYGYFYRDAPSTHLFSQPHLGEMVNAGIYWATAEPFISAAVLIDPGHFEESETPLVGRVLQRDGVVVCRVFGQQATMQNTRLFIEAFPYDLLFICSHCGEVEGEQLTMRIPDASGGPHIVEIDRVLQFGLMSPDLSPGRKVEVQQLLRPVSIDGIDWHAAEPDVKQHYEAIWKYLQRTPHGEWEILNRKQVARVPHSTAIQLHQGWLMLNLTNAVDARVSPVIFNNSCVSFYDAAKAMTFAGARSYVGTLVPVYDTSARQIAESLFTGTERSMSLPLALAKTQEHVFTDPEERTYVHVGCHFTAVRTSGKSESAVVRQRVQNAKANWQSRLRQGGPDKRGKLLEVISFLSRFVASGASP